MLYQKKGVHITKPSNWYSCRVPPVTLIYSGCSRNFSDKFTQGLEGGVSFLMIVEMRSSSSSAVKFNINNYMKNWRRFSIWLIGHTHT